MQEDEKFQNELKEMILNCSEQAQMSLQERMNLESKIDEAFGEDFKPKQICRTFKVLIGKQEVERNFSIQGLLLQVKRSGYFSLP